MNSTYSYRVSLGVFCGIAASVLLTGCEIFGPPPPPPRASWQPAPGFSADSLSKIAVIAEDRSSRRGWGSDDSLSRSVEDEFIANLFRKGYRVSTRSDVEPVLKEIRFQGSGLTEADGAKLGRMLNVSGVLIVTINSASVTMTTINGWMGYF